MSPDCRSRRVGYPGRGNIKTRFQYITIPGKRLPGPQEVGLLPVGPREVFYFPPTTHRRPMEAPPIRHLGTRPLRVTLCGGFTAKFIVGSSFSEETGLVTCRVIGPRNESLLCNQLIALARMIGERIREKRDLTNKKIVRNIHDRDKVIVDKERYDPEMVSQGECEMTGKVSGPQS
ncbi:hypothetical protein CDAR_570011 [Caerostris darwini]|uniref:Ribosomal protein S3 n=1 Tax=Caerostris darwini TaxID=1538125 RepID=A0AAV4S1G1_9ARAC|nr:hypothetical protein CDAR_570011 [Caerostris darwini]